RVDYAVAALPLAVGAAKAVGGAVVDPVVASFAVADEAVAAASAERAVGLAFVVADPVVHAVIADLAIADHAVAAVRSPLATGAALLGFVVGGDVEPVIALLGTVYDRIAATRCERAIRVTGSVRTSVLCRAEVAGLVTDHHAVSTMRRAHAL